MELNERIKTAFLGMKRKVAVETVKEALQSGAEPLAVLKACREAMEEVGKRFETGEFFLSELIYSAEVFKSISAILEPVLVSGQQGGRVQGDHCLRHASGGYSRPREKPGRHHDARPGIRRSRSRASTSRPSGSWRRYRRPGHGFSPCRH